MQFKEALATTSDLDDFVAALKILKSFSHIIQRFNYDFEKEMAAFDAVMKKISKIDESHSYPSLTMSSRMPQADLVGYKRGDRGQCIVTYINDIEKSLCFIVDRKT